MSSSADGLTPGDGPPRGENRVLYGNQLYDEVLPCIGSGTMTRRIVESILLHPESEVHRIINDDFLLSDILNDEVDNLAQNGEIVRSTEWPRMEGRLGGMLITNDKTIRLGPRTQMPRVVQPEYSHRGPIALGGNTQGNVNMTMKEVEKVADEVVDSLLDLIGKFELADESEALQDGQYRPSKKGLAHRLEVTGGWVNPAVAAYHEAVRILVEETERSSTMNESLLAEVELKVVITATKIAIARKAPYVGEERSSVEDRIQKAATEASRA